MHDFYKPSRHVPGYFAATLLTLLTAATIMASGLLPSAASATSTSGSKHTASSKSTTTSSATNNSSGRVIAAAYFGSANPINFWSSDLSQARAQLQQIKANGFNAVDFVLPWGDFQPSITPTTYNSVDFKRLDDLVSLADSLHLGVLLRLSYEFDVYPTDQGPYGDRVLSLYGSPTAYQAWLNYISKVHQTVAKFHNIKAVYLSWEDFWQPVWAAEAAKAPKARLQLAQSIGFQTWLQTQESLAQVSSDYGVQYSSWSQVPTPSYTSPSFALMYKYADWMMSNRFFAGANQRFPGMTIEARVENDQYYSGKQVAGTYSHSATWQLPGTTVTGIYYSPYMNDPSTDHNETAQDSLSGLQTTLSTVSAGSGGRRLYIYEYEIVSNAAVISQAPQLATDQVPAFVRASPSLLKQYTNGYALWTYRDFYLSPVYNPSFAVGLKGWTVHGKTKVTASTRTTSYLTMSKGSSISQVVPPNHLKVTSTAPITVSVEAATKSGTAHLGIAVGSATQTFSVRPGWHTYQIQLTKAQLGVGQVTLSADAAVQVTNVQDYWFTQVGDIYNTAGAPVQGGALGAMQYLNHQLTSG